ncbi:MAG: zinc-finger domain-containing protein [Micropepsaceae bacterium]
MTTPAPEVVTVNKRRIACDGGGALGHPKVFLEMGTDSQVECPYCDRKFVLSREAAEAEHH